MRDLKTDVISVDENLTSKGPKQAYLIILRLHSGSGMGKMLKLDQSVFVIGRGADADLIIDDEGISRRHTRIVRDPSGDFTLEDMGSTNGTFLNGVRIKNAPLSDGDKLQLGSGSIFKFSLSDKLEEQFQKSIYESATRDALTRLYNKVHFLEMLDKELSYSVRHKSPISLVVFDVDHFKRVNDLHGHLEGDRALKWVSQRLLETIRNEDVLGRYGGEEFIAILRASPEERGVRMADRCRLAVANGVFQLRSGAPLPLRISGGVTGFLGEARPPIDELISLADAQLYRAKRLGRNRVMSSSIPDA